MVSILGNVEISKICFKKGVNKSDNKLPSDVALLPRDRICTLASTIELEFLRGNDCMIILHFDVLTTIC